MKKITVHPFSVSVDWHLPEAEFHEATVELLGDRAPSGLPFASWSVAGDRHPASTRSIRARLERHDGPLFIEVSAADTAGELWNTIAGESYSNSTITVSAAPSMLRNPAR